MRVIPAPTREAEAGAGGQLGLQSETLSQKTNKTKQDPQWTWGMSSKAMSPTTVAAK